MSQKIDKRFISILVFSFIVFIYTTVCLKVNKTIFKLSDVPYYNYLVESLFKQRIDINTKAVPNTHDLSLYKGKYYMYWGPSPVFFILPFYLLDNVKTSDVFYTLVAGLLNIVIFYYVVLEITKHFQIKLTYFKKILLVSCFAFGSPNFYLSLAGRIWLTNQIISILYLLLFLYFVFRYLNGNFKLIDLFLASIFFCLSWFSRNTLVVYGLFYFYLFWKLGEKDKNKLFIHFVSVFIVFSLFVFSYVFYNYLRFGNYFETGIHYQQAAGRYAEDIRKGKLFSFDFIKNNFQHYFLSPAYLILTTPNIIMEDEGSSIFSVYPITIFLFFIFNKRHFSAKDIKLFLSITLMIVFMIWIVLLTFVGTGWKQFGSRYFFDAIPAVFIIILFVLSKIPNTFLMLMVLYSYLINYFGSLLSFMR